MQHLKAGPQTTLLNPKADYMDFSGAYDLVSRIQAYWDRRGKFPKVWAELVPQTMSSDDLYQVRSNMVGGQPIA